MDPSIDFNKFADHCTLMSTGLEQQKVLQIAVAAPRPPAFAIVPPSTKMERPTSSGQYLCLVVKPKGQPLRRRQGLPARSKQVFLLYGRHIALSCPQMRSKTRVKNVEPPADESAETMEGKEAGNGYPRRGPQLRGSRSRSFGFRRSGGC